MGTLTAQATVTNGGFTSLGRKSVSWYIRGNEPEQQSRPVTVKQGQVLKALSWVSSDANGKLIAYGALTESAKITFAGSATSAQTVVIGGLTLTTTAAMTSAEVIAAFIKGSTTKGTFSGTSAWTFRGESTGLILYADSLTLGSNVTDITVTGSASMSATISTSQGTASSTTGVVTGLLVMDVDATSADVKAQIFTAGNFYSDAIVWAVDVAVDKITKSDGTTVACTAYNTGCETELTRQKFLELTAGGTAFAIGTFNAGEVEL